MQFSFSELPPIRPIAWVTPITAAPSCKEQNSAGLEGIFAGLESRALCAEDYAYNPAGGCKNGSNLGARSAREGV
jgi:hypothetical protein